MLLAFAAALGTGGPARTEPQAPPAPAAGARLAAPAVEDSLAARREHVIRLLVAKEFPAAEAAAKDLVARCETARGPGALETARAIALWARARLEQGATSDSTMLAAVERAVRIEEQADAGAHSELAEVLKLAGLLQQYAGALDAALARLERVVHLNEQLYGSDHAETGAALVNLGRAYNAGGDFAKARPCFERAVGIYQRVYGADSPKLINALQQLAQAQHNQGEYAAAERSYAQLIRIVESEGVADNPKLITALRAQAWNLSTGLQRPADAIPLLQRSLALAERVHGADSPSLVRTLTSLGVTYSSMGDPGSALPYHQRAVALCEAVPPTEANDLDSALNSLGSCLSDLGRYDEAKEVLARALAVIRERKGADHPDVAAALLNTGVLAYSMGDYDLARQRFEGALAIDEARLGPSHPSVAEDVNNVAGIRYFLGDLDRAAAGFERAVAIATASLGQDHVDVGKWTTNLANCVAAQGDLARALELFERGLAIQRAAPDANPVEFAAGLLDYARVLALVGRTREALEPAEQALAVRREALGEHHPDTARARQALGNVLAMLGESARAREQLHDAAAALEAALGPAHPDVGNASRDLALLDLAQGEPAAAAEQALRAERVGREHLRLIARGLSERETLAYAAVRSTGCDVALAAALQAPQAGLAWRAWDQLVRSRALVLDEMAARRRIAAASTDVRVAGLAQRLQRARTRLANLATRQEPGRGAAAAELLATAQSQKETAERELAASVAPLAQQLARDRIGLDAVAAALPSGAALLAYGRAYAPDHAPRLCALALTGGSKQVRVIDLGPAADVEQALHDWRQAVAAGASLPGPLVPEGERLCREAGATLRRAVWDPVTVELGRVEQLYIVPDGALHLVAFGALPADGGRYLIEQGPTVHLLTSERDLVATSGPSPGPRVLLALGGPDFDAALEHEPAEASPAAPARFRGVRSACAELGQLRFAPLPGAAQEVRAIPQLLGRAHATARSTVLTGRDATEARLKAEVAGARIVHMATHGFVLGGGCAAAAPAAESGWTIRPGGGPPRDPSRENPLLRCGLAFAGANHRQEARADQEDGILTAEEIASLDLSRAEWVVLSACDTGAGELATGDGVLSLRRAFQIAGASTIIHTLWQVDDRIARRWVDALYRQRYESHVSTAEAAREATVSLIAELRRAGRSPHPFYWAAFVATESGRSTNTPTSD